GLPGPPVAAATGSPLSLPGGRSDVLRTSGRPPAYVRSRSGRRLEGARAAVSEATIVTPDSATALGSLAASPPARSLRRSARPAAQSRVARATARATVAVQRSRS